MISCKKASLKAIALFVLSLGGSPTAMAQGGLLDVYGGEVQPGDGEAGFNWDFHKCVAASCTGATLVNVDPRGDIGPAGCTWDGVNPGGVCTGVCKRCAGTGTTNLCVQDSTEKCSVGTGGIFTCGTINEAPCFFSTTQTQFERPCACSLTSTPTTNSCDIGSCT